MNFKEKLQSVLQRLNFMAKAKTLTTGEWNQVIASYQDAFGTSLQEDMAADQAASTEGDSTVPLMTAEQMTQIQSILSGLVPESNSNDGEGDDNEDTTSQSSASGEDLVALATQISAIVNTMKNQATVDIPCQTIESGTVMFVGPADRSKYLFGIDNPIFSMSKRWNQVAANPNAASSLGAWDEELEGAAFRKEAVSYSRDLKKRFCYLHENGMLNADKLAAGDFSTSYPGVTEAKVGDQFVIRRQDALIARVLQKRDLTQFFPVRYGIQDHDLVFNTFFDEVSQSYQEGEIWKGGMQLENEMGHVDDAMIKIKFGAMKKIERMYIGYLNKEGSDPIKWSMIEFCILNSLETAQVEQNKRRVRGCYCKPAVGKPGHYLNASTGLLYTLIRYYHENKILLHSDATYASYTSSDMLSAVQEFVSDVTESCSEDMDLDKHVLYLNKTHQPWWIKNIRTSYGTQTDFTGPNSYLNVVPDTNMRIIWLPYLGKLPFMFMDIPGNLQFLEYVPGEMLGIKVKEDMELVKAWSTWKEGCAAAFVGRKFDTPAKLLANNYEWQQIFMNKPIVKSVADATICDASKGFWFETIANTKATVLTDITGAKAGTVYIIECGSLANATTIGKSDKFSTLTAAWTPTSVGDYIMVALNSDGKFDEFERQVAGVRTINSKIQPNIPGVR